MQFVCSLDLVSQSRTKRTTWRVICVAVAYRLHARATLQRNFLFLIRALMAFFIAYPSPYEIGCGQGPIRSGVSGRTPPCGAALRAVFERWRCSPSAPVSATQYLMASEGKRHNALLGETVPSRRPQQLCGPVLCGPRSNRGMP